QSFECSQTLQSIIDLGALLIITMKLLPLAILLLVKTELSLQKVDGRSNIQEGRSFMQSRATKCKALSPCSSKGGTCVSLSRNCAGTLTAIAGGCSGPNKCKCCLPPCPTDCPTGFTQVDTQCLSFQTSALTWANAQAACQRLGGRLAKAKDATALATYINANYAGQNFWLGASDSHTEGEWLWTSGGTVSNIWMSGEPNNAGSGEDCMMYWGATVTGYIDEPCSDSASYICEADFQ
ncbi:unnamed protein product, partial [Meganyctiphanes norvegica]